MAKIQLLLLLTIATFAIISSVQSVPVKDSSVEKNNSEKCQKLCGFCGCKGYYCGDECLCECNSQTDGEAECVDTMKSNCKKLELPFEVLIQGPNVNRMVRSLLYADPEQEQVCAKSSETHQTKRSTISIYKPDAMNQRDEILSAPKSDVSSRVPMDRESVQVVVAEKSSAPEMTPTKVEPTSDDKVEDNPTVESNLNIKLSSSEDGIDRVNTKRHIVDVNQEIADFESIKDTENSPVFKRDAAEVAAEVVAAAAPEVVAAAAPEVVALAAPVAVHKIPNHAETIAAWEGLRAVVNKKISDVIAAVKVKQDLKFDAAKLKFDKDEVGAKLLAAVAAAKAVKLDFKTDAIKLALADAALKLPIKMEIAKDIADIKINHHIFRDAARLLKLDDLILPVVLGAAADDVGAVAVDGNAV